MIDLTELAICRKRGHKFPLLAPNKWEQCTWCKMWLREVKTIEEREDEPPKEDQNPLSKYADGKP